MLSRKIGCRPFRRGLRNKRLSPQEKAEIVGMFHGGSTVKDIACYMQCHISSIYRVVKKTLGENPFLRKPGSGRPRKTSQRDVTRIIREVKKNPSITGHEIKANLLLNNISERTVRRRIASDSEFASYWKTKKPYISPRNRMKRMKFAKDHIHWTTVDWQKVLWSDESPFVLIFNRKTRVWRLHNERYKVKSTIATVKHDKKINVWGCFCASGVGKLYRIEGILLKEEYNKILNTQMLPSAKSLFRRRYAKTWIFQEDNDPKHTAKVNKEWIKKKGIRRLDWPAQSPDLNPIENLWSILDQRCKNRKPANEEELFNRLKEEWESLPTSMLQSLCESMPRRLQAVIDAKGYATKY